MGQPARPKQQQTYLRRGENDQFQLLCRICPRRQSRNLPNDQRAGVWFDSKEEAIAQAKRHRSSDFHQETVLRLAANTPTDEEIVLAKIFGTPVRLVCESCGFHHSPKLGCVDAAQIRDREGLSI